MKHATIMAACATLALAACGKSAGPVPEASASATAEAMPTATPSVAGVPFTAGEPPSKAFMVGTWGEGDACAMPITFAADGTITDGPFATWDIVDGRLVMKGAPNKMALKVVDAKTIESRIEKDEPRTLKRC